MSEQELLDWMKVYPPAANTTASAELEARTRLKQLGGAPAVAVLDDLDEVESDYSALLEDRMFLLVGTVCIQAGRSDLWSAIWRLAHAGDDFREDEFAVLEELTALARRGEL